MLGEYLHAERTFHRKDTAYTAAFIWIIFLHYRVVFVEESFAGLESQQGVDMIDLISIHSGNVSTSSNCGKAKVKNVTGAPWRIACIRSQGRAEA